MIARYFSPDLLRGKVALITGGSSGINKSIAARFIEHGARVAIVARDANKLSRAADELNSLTPGSCLKLQADVRDGAAMLSAATSCAEHLGPLDIVIAGAAGNFLGSAAKLSSNAFAAVIDIDLKGTFHTFKACHPHLRPAARLIAISAPQGSIPIPMQAHACAAKAGIEALVRTLAIEWGGLEGARVNAISPGLVAQTEGAAIFASAVGDDALVGHQPVPRFATLDEVANVALFLASPMGDYITGHVLAIDGGLTLLTNSAAAIGLAAGKVLEAGRTK